MGRLVLGRPGLVTLKEERGKKRALKGHFHIFSYFCQAGLRTQSAPDAAVPGSRPDYSFDVVFRVVLNNRRTRNIGLLTCIYLHVLLIYLQINLINEELKQ